jgi:hypothetical protein
MTENTKDLAANGALITEDRAAWCRPQLRRLDAAEAQTTLIGLNADIAFS